MVRTKQYVLGLAYTEDRQSVLLVKKRRPDWQRGRLNAIGGRIEPGEEPEAAMRREGLEEAGLDLEWQHRGLLAGTNDDGKGFMCHLFVYCGARVEGYRQLEDEPLGLYRVAAVQDPGENVVDNLRVLVPFGLLALADPRVRLCVAYADPREGVRP